MTYKDIKEKYVKAGQGHVFCFFDQLSAIEQSTFVTQLSTIDIDRTLDHYFNIPSALNNIEPIPLDLVGHPTDAYFERGLDLISKNQVAVLLMAGGQGTRLGSDDPKGCYDIGLPSHKSLFQLQAERIRRLEILATRTHPVVIPWYIMTSGSTDRATQTFFHQYDFFGLDPNQVMFFKQGVLPCLNPDGKFILESKGKVRHRVFYLF
jgi:UDP-N-acetylglucosamine/UDP-N-acetylgalactosamine diphosphorylase